MSAVSGRRNGHSWSQDKAGGERGKSLTYFRMQILSNNRSSICKGELCWHVCPLSRLDLFMPQAQRAHVAERSSSARPAQHTPSSPRWRAGITPLALKTSAGCLGAGRLWTCPLALYKWGWRHWFLSQFLNSSWIWRVPSNTGRIPSSDPGTAPVCTGLVQFLPCYSHSLLTQNMQNKTCPWANMWENTLRE